MSWLPLISKIIYTLETLLVTLLQLYITHYILHIAQTLAYIWLYSDIIMWSLVLICLRTVQAKLRTIWLQLIVRRISYTGYTHKGWDCINDDLKRFKLNNRFFSKIFTFDDIIDNLAKKCQWFQFNRKHLQKKDLIDFVQSSLKAHSLWLTLYLLKQIIKGIESLQQILIF